jgi:hypothetical protein
MEMKVTIILLALGMLTLSSSQLLLAIRFKRLERKVEYMSKGMRALNSKRCSLSDREISFRI